MTSASFDRSIDFSTLAQPAGASYVMDVDEATLEGLVRKSVQHLVIFEFTSARAHGADQLSATLAELANEAAGKYLLGRVDIDAQPAIAQALQVQAVPMVAAALGGQLIPLFQGTADKEQAAAAIDQVLQMAAANGIMGKAEPVAQAVAEPTPGEEAAPVADPRFAAADAALMAGDYVQAVAEFDKVLANAPGDSEATAGRAQASLLARTTGVNPQEVSAAAGASPNDIEAQFAAADLEVIQGANEAALDRLLSLAADLDAEGREQVRVRILELFEVIGRADPVVLKARRRLSGLLF